MAQPLLSTITHTDPFLLVAKPHRGAGAQERRTLLRRRLAHVLFIALFAGALGLLGYELWSARQAGSSAHSFVTKNFPGLARTLR